MWNIKENILFEDRCMIVCKKKAGIPVQSARIGTWDMENGLKTYLSEKQSAHPAYVGIIHRLDQPVEGVLVFAKTSAAAKELSRQLNTGEMGKYYLAVTKGKPPALQGTLENWLKKDAKSNKSYVVPKEKEGAKYAKLYYQVRQKAEMPDGTEKFLLEIKLDTGRHHQIRVQLANAGMPLVGDKKYYLDGEENTSLGLCAARLVFAHPVTRKKMEFSVRPEGNAFEGFDF